MRPDAFLRALLALLLLALGAGLPAAPAQATQALLPRACVLPGDQPLTWRDATTAQGWNCSPAVDDLVHPYLWMRVDGSDLVQSEPLLLRTDSLGFERIVTVVEFGGTKHRLRSYVPEELGKHWTLGTRFAVPLTETGERIERVWLRVDRPLDRNTAALAGVTTVAADAQQRLDGMVMFALFCGMLLVVAIYSLALSAALRSRFALWHGIMVVLFLGYTVVASSLVFMVLPDLSLWHRAATSYLLLALSMAMVTPFFLSFLEPFALPRWTRVVMASCSALVALAGVGFVLLAHQFPFVARPVYHAAYIPAVLSFAVVCPIAWSRGSEAIRLVALAWAMPVLVALDRILRGLNVYTMPTEWDFAFFAAMAWQSLVMAAAINWRIGKLKEERDTARAQEQALGHLALTDDLTGLPNRRAFDTRDWREGDFLAIVDADHFKLINDRLGHQAGDHVLQAIGAELALAVREMQGCLAAFRLGGEEFALLVVARTHDEAALLVNALRHQLAAAVTAQVNRLPARLTLSAGLARIGPDGVVPAYRAADRALYKAKNSGRDLLCYETRHEQGSAMIFPRRAQVA